MKSLLLMVIILACGTSLRADNLLQNGDFAQGSAHWEGDGKTPADYARANPLRASPSAKSLIVPLNPQAWTKIFQEFTGGNGSTYSINVAYMVSPDLKLSDKPQDYASVNKHLDLKDYEDFGDINVPLGQFFGTIGDVANNKIALEFYLPKIGSKEVQNYQHTYPPLTALGDKTVALAFPPGTGAVVILSVSVTTN